MTDLTRPEIDARFAATEAKVDARLGNIENTMQSGFAMVRAEMAEMRAELRSEMQAMKSEIIKWVAGTAIALGVAGIVAMTAGVTVTTFVLNNAVQKAAPAVPAAPPQIIITVPGAQVQAAPAVPAPQQQK